jgi:transcription antitermination factor NusG
MSRAEKQVAQRLEKCGITYYLPLIKVRKQWSDRIKKVDLPAFPSYLFVNTELFRHTEIMGIQGIARFVHFEGKPAILQPKIIENLKRIIESDSLLGFQDKPLKAGDTYIFPSGPLKGIEGKIVRIKGKKHFYMEIQELGKYISIPIYED